MTSQRLLRDPRTSSRSRWRRRELARSPDVREARAPLLPSAELPSDLGTERTSALFDRLRSLDEAPAPPGETYSPSKVSGEEAEVTIVSVEGLKQRREARWLGSGRPGQRHHRRRPGGSGRGRNILGSGAG